MAWRIAEQVIRGELDSRVRGQVTGTIWLIDRPEPLRLALDGNPWRDLAGVVFRFTNPNPVANDGDLRALVSDQSGVCGDITASRRVRITPEPVREWLLQGAPGKHCLPWGNCVYIEWFSEANGRVVVESTHFTVEVSAAAWSLTDVEETEQRRRNGEAMDAFMQRLVNHFTPPASDLELPADTPATAVNPESDDRSLGTKLDQVTRIEELKRKTRDVAGEFVEHQGSEALPLDVQQQFWQNVLEFESAQRKRRREILAEDGFHALAPDCCSDAEITTELWRLIAALAKRRTFLTSTNHLSDRELYTLLVTRVLEEETQCFHPESQWNTRIAIDEYGMPGDHEFGSTYLRFYADEATRARWAKDVRGAIPPHCDPPYDRDRLLPQ